MSLAIKYENTEDAKMRLRQTVVLYKGAPVLITDVAAPNEKGEILRVMFRELPNTPKLDDRPFGERIKALEAGEDGLGEQKRKYISSKHFDIAPFKMGYVNSSGKFGAFHCARMPNRVQKQGLCGDNFKGRDNYGNQVGFNVFLSCKEVPAMVGGDYPSFDRALKALGKVPAVAFSREFCLVRDEVIPDLIYLYHKGSKVGMYSKDVVCLGKKFTCLKESIQEMRIKVGEL